MNRLSIRQRYLLQLGVLDSVREDYRDARKRERRARDRVSELSADLSTLEDAFGSERTKSADRSVDLVRRELAVAEIAEYHARLDCSRVASILYTEEIALSEIMMERPCDVRPNRSED